MAISPVLPGRGRSGEKFGKFIGIGPFVFFLSTDIPLLAAMIETLYEGFPAWEASANRFADFHVGVHRVSGMRRIVRRQAVFDIDGFRPFFPLASGQALMMLEGGLNWAIAENISFFLVIHAGVVERNGLAMVLPAPPGGGKSTLTAGLVHRGWRLLSDELALLSLEEGTLSALARPIALKNESIGVIRRAAPQSWMTPPMPNIEGGDVIYLKPPADSVARIGERAVPAFIVVPRFQRDADAALLEPKSRPQAFRELADGTYRLSLYGRRGFETLAGMVDRCQCYDLRFSDLDAAIQACERLTRGALRR